MKIKPAGISLQLKPLHDNTIQNQKADHHINASMEVTISMRSTKPCITQCLPYQKKLSYTIGQAKYSEYPYPPSEQKYPWVL